MEYYTATFEVSYITTKDIRDNNLKNYKDIITNFNYYGHER